MVYVYVCACMCSMHMCLLCMNILKCSHSCTRQLIWMSGNNLKYWSSPSPCLKHDLLLFASVYIWTASMQAYISPSSFIVEYPHYRHVLSCPAWYGEFHSVSVAVIKCYDQKQPGEERGYFILSLQVYDWGKSDLRSGVKMVRYLETRTDIEAMWVCSLLDLLLWLVQPPFFYHPGPPIQV